MNRRTHPLRANGAAFIDSLGQRPTVPEAKSPSAESATHFRVESRLQPLLDNCLPGFPGALPQADLTRAPLALNRCRRIIVSFSCVLALGFTVAAFAQDEEEEASNAKPDAGGIVIEPSSGKIAEGDTITITFPVSMKRPSTFTSKTARRTSVFQSK